MKKLKFILDGADQMMRKHLNECARSKCNQGFVQWPSLDQFFTPEGTVDPNVQYGLKDLPPRFRFGAKKVYTRGGAICPQWCVSLNSPTAREQPEVSSVCPETYDVVCGVNGSEYRNECFAYRSGVAVAYKGKCIPPETCTAFWNPSNLKSFCELCTDNNFFGVRLVWDVDYFSDPKIVTNNMNLKNCTTAYEIQMLGDMTNWSTSSVDSIGPTEYLSRTYVPFAQGRQSISVLLSKSLDRTPYYFRIRAVPSTNIFELQNLSKGSWYNFPGLFSKDICCPV
jgi:hypothetical protein